MSYAIDLSGKVALVTGGSRGLGRAIALGLASAGANVIVSSRKLDACKDVAREIEALGRRAAPIAAHVGRWDDITRLVEESYAAFGRIDVLVNNAGMSPLAPSSLETSEDLFDKIVGVNFKGPFRLTALVGSRMAAGDGGSIINVSSIGALKPNPSVTPYSGAKAALNAISLAFAQEYAPKVRVNVISPGGFLTDVAKEWATPEEARAVTALERWGDAEEIVGAALYLASDASSYTTGANLRIDGGAFWDRKPNG
ncbi:MAG TPA: SDR family oxidoreductase [Caulobacterales bacterium]|nr:SDR family oxidoreductase [Caulobacterales bacterium]